MKMFKASLLAVAALGAMTFASCSKADTSDKSDAADKTEKAEKKVEKVATILDFNATWCGPCKQFAPIFEAAAEKYAGKVEFKSVDVDIDPALAEKYGVQSIPMVVLLDKNGNVLEESVGLIGEEDFDLLINKYL